jgi:REP element-mobilizing transposase RayT
VKQHALALRTWGGARSGAGRKAAGVRKRVPHSPREGVRASRPVHVTLRVAGPVWNLRSERAYAIIHRALAGIRRRSDFRVVHYSIQGNHLHLLVEADGARSLACGMKGLAIRLARRLNGMMGRRGPVFEDRFHAHVLRTPAEVRNALRYVLDNRARHLERLGQGAPRAGPDRYSSASTRTPLGGQLELFDARVARPLRTWLLRDSERRTASDPESGR